MIKDSQKKTKVNKKMNEGVVKPIKEKKQTNINKGTITKTNQPKVPKEVYSYLNDINRLFKEMVNGKKNNGGVFFYPKDIKLTYTILLNCTPDELKQLANDSETPTFIKTACEGLTSNRLNSRIAMTNRLLDRVIGTPKPDAIEIHKTDSFIEIENKDKDKDDGIVINFI